MAINATFESSLEGSLDLIEQSLGSDTQVSVQRHSDRIEVLARRRPSFFSRKEKPLEVQATFYVSESFGAKDATAVRLQDDGSEAWLFRRLIRVVDAHSRESRMSKKSHAQGPLTFKALLGFGGGSDDSPSESPLPGFFGAAKKRARAKDTTTDAGAFTKAKDTGKF